MEEQINKDIKQKLPGTPGGYLVTVQSIFKTIYDSFEHTSNIDADVDYIMQIAMDKTDDIIANMLDKYIVSGSSKTSEPKETPTEDEVEQIDLLTDFPWNSKQIASWRDLEKFLKDKGIKSNSQIYRAIYNSSSIEKIERGKYRHIQLPPQ